MRRFWRETLLAAVVLSVASAMVVLTPQPSSAIPAFSRKYQTSCTTCHLDFPKLNDFGKAFKDAGFKFPKDDESFIKQPPVLLGAEAQKQLWPHTVWPGEIPGMPPIGLRMNNFFQVVGKNRGNFNSLLAAPGTVPPFIPKADFQTGFFSIFTAGNFGDGLAFWVDDDLSVAGQNGNGGLGDGYLKFIDLSSKMKMPKDSFSLRAGQFELDLPFTQARSINLSGYDIYSQANFGSLTPPFGQQNTANQFAFAGAGQGVEISGGHQYGGYHYSIAAINQNTSGTQGAAASVPFIDPANGVAFSSDANFKDIYSRFSYRFNLEKDQESRNAVQAAGPMGPRDHTYLNLGTYYFYGRSVQRLSGLDTTGAPVILTAREPFYRVGGDFSFNYRTFNLFGLYMYGHDHNLLPIDATGTLVPLPISPATPPQISGFVRGTPTTFSGGFMEADYLAFPWLMAIMRWDSVNSTSDRINGLAGSPVGSFFVPFRSTRNRFTPGMQFLIRANVKASFEYQYRPQQSVTVVTNPLTGLPMAISPFRTNTVVVALEYVY